MLKKIGLGLVILGGASLGVFLRFYRPWHSRWGATDEEVALEMPGDEIIKQPTFNVTRAITIRAHPEEIWPTIVTDLILMEIGDFPMMRKMLHGTERHCW